MHLPARVLLPTAVALSTTACQLDAIGDGDATSAAAVAATPLDSSIMLMGEWDWALRPDQTSRCTEMVDRAAAAGSTTANFVPTHFFRAHTIGTGTTGAPLWQVHGYCYKPSASCADFTWAAIDRFERGVRACMARAVAHGMHLAVVPHLDDGAGQGVWRNSVVFEPTAKHGGFSYADVLLYPLARAIRDTMAPTTRVYLATQGEMGATVFAHPGPYAYLLDELRGMIAGGDPGRVGRVEVGVSLNFNVVAGGVGAIDQAEVRRLFEAADFVGLSSYGPVDPYPHPDDFDRTIDGFAAELAGHGLDLRALHDGGTRLHFSELGIGGGVRGEGDLRAQTRAQAAATPYFGVYGEYRADRDPWVGDLAAFRRDFHAAALTHLRGGGRWRVDRAFLLSLDSWDVQAVYPISTSAQGSYRDEAIVAAIRAHNASAGAAPWCRDPASDPDGDGWGWEDGQSCRTYPICRDPASDPDGDGWGWEDGQSCRSSGFMPASSGGRHRHGRGTDRTRTM
jgi:hypothetical protein